MATLEKAYKDMLMKMKPNDITQSFMFEYLSDKSEIKNGKMITIPSKIRTSDVFTLEANEYFNKTKVLTNAGLFIFNKFLIEESFKDIIGYVNEPVNGDVQKSIERKLSKALLNDVITIDSFVTYLNKTQWLSKSFNSVLSSSFTMKSIKPLPNVMKRRNQLIKENAEEIKNGNIVKEVEIESELKELAKKELKGDPGMDLYDSGARGSFGNNYKSIALMKGPIFNPATGKWDFVGSNFMDGIKKDEIPVYANTIVTGAYPKAVATQSSGYLSKQLTAAFQGISLDTPGSDCGTTNYLSILLTNNMKNDFMYRYIIDKGKLVRLDDDNINKYVGTVVKLRSPMLCAGKKLCSKCAGEMYYKLKINNIGLTTSKISTSLLNLNMKKFHDSSANIVKLDAADLTL